MYMKHHTIKINEEEKIFIKIDFSNAYGSILLNDDKLIDPEVKTLKEMIYEYLNELEVEDETEFTLDLKHLLDIT